MSALKIAIVTTLRDAGPMLDSFVTYHLRNGFARLYLFFDDPADPDLARLAGHPMVSAIAHDEVLRERWARLPEYAIYGAHIGREVMARQVLNVALAQDLARQDGCDWLLHIDSDELFFAPKQAVAAHFLEVNALPVDTVCYRNFEAVPEKADIIDPFREVDLFKVPPELGAGPFDRNGYALLANTPQIPQKRFHFYRNGKAAVRLGARDMRPGGVHRFGRPGGTTNEAQATDAFVLHYPCCGFDAFWQKYKTLGVFGDIWLGTFDIRQAIGPLHLDARDMVAGNDREAALAFYRQRIAIEDKTRAEQLIRHGILTRFAQPRDFLDRQAPSAGG